MVGTAVFLGISGTDVMFLTSQGVDLRIDFVLETYVCDQFVPRNSSICKFEGDITINYVVGKRFKDLNIN